MTSTNSRTTDRALLDRLAADYQAVRLQTEAFCRPLSPEDFVVQSMPDASPAKWHLAHTTWFFETFALKPYLGRYADFHPSYSYLFNSYYNAVGERLSRPDRGLLTRPPIEEVFAYRRHVDGAIESLLATADEGLAATLESLITLGLHHEQQHQELLLTDLKHAFSLNPLRPAYREPKPSATDQPPSDRSAPDARDVAFPEGIRWIGHPGDGFHYDNEGPRHRQFLNSFRLSNRLVTNGDYLEFIEAGGYEEPGYWLSDGWAACRNQGWQAPLYWERSGDDWTVFTLEGMKPLDPAEPVCHVSYYEADAFARWAGARLPTEAEWETAADVAIAGNFLESGALRPVALSVERASEAAEPLQMFGDVWEWTASPYAPYPGFQPREGAIGEYNGKFMANQFVLRGGSCATPRNHVRSTYRNFFYPDARWQFSGIRLADPA